MNCQSFENSLTDLARQHPLEATAQAEALEHGRSCSSCALRLDEQRALTVGLRSLAGEMKTVQTPSHVEGRLMEAFRQGRLQPQRTHATRRAWYAMAAVAAVLLVLFGVVALRLSWAPASSPVAIETGNDKPVKTSAPQVLTPVSTVVPPVPERVTPPKPIRASHNSSRRTARQRVKQTPGLTPDRATTATAAAEVMTEFMQLGDVSVANLQEGAQVVRVEMPRYAMARFGLPVNMERYDERVKADVWLGADGVARAIRFVQ